MNMKLKRVSSFILVLSLLFVFTACSSGPTPTETAEGFLEGVKSLDKEKVAEFYAGETDDVDFSSSDAAIFDDDFDFMDQKDLIDKLVGFDYAVQNEKISDDEKTATVDVVVTSYAFGDMIKELMSEAITEAFANMLDDDYDIEKFMEEKLAEKVANLKKDYSETVKLDIVKNDDGNWVVAAMDDDAPLLNAITGNLFKVVDDLDDTFSEEDIDE